MASAREFRGPAGAVVLAAALTGLSFACRPVESDFDPATLPEIVPITGPHDVDEDLGFHTRPFFPTVVLPRPFAALFCDD